MKISYDFPTKINVYDDNNNITGVITMNGINYGGDIHFEPTPGNVNQSIKNLHDALGLLLKSQN